MSEIKRIIARYASIDVSFGLFAIDSTAPDLVGRAVASAARRMSTLLPEVTGA